MSQNVAVVERVVDAINRGDIDAVVESLSDDFEFDFSNSRGPMSGVYRGRDGMREFLTSFAEAWASLEFDPQAEVIELQDRRVLTVSAFRARGHGSGVEVQATGASIWTVRDGQLAALSFYQSKDEALDVVSAES